MPCISGTFNPSIGPLLGFAAVPPMGASGIPQQISGHFGLVDTGATKTCISPQIAANAGLDPIGKANMTSASHTNTAVNLYLVDVILAFGQVPSGAGASGQLPVLVIENIQVIEFPGTPNFQALIGRDILCQGHLTMSFNGTFTFCV